MKLRIKGRCVISSNVPIPCPLCGETILGNHHCSRLATSRQKRKSAGVLAKRRP